MEGAPGRDSERHPPLTRPPGWVSLRPGSPDQHPGPVSTPSGGTAGLSEECRERPLYPCISLQAPLKLPQVIMEESSFESQSTRCKQKDRQDPRAGSSQQLGTLLESRRALINALDFFKHTVRCRNVRPSTYHSVPIFEKLFFVFEVTHGGKITQSVKQKVEIHSSLTT